MFKLIKRSFALRYSLNPKNSKSCAVHGAQWGNEGILNYKLGKTKIINKIANDFNLCARFNGRTSHKVKFDGKTFISQLIPTGILHPHCKNIIGGGAFINPTILLNEIKQLKDQKVSIDNRLLISER